MNATPQPSTLKPQPYTLTPKPYILKPNPYPLQAMRGLLADCAEQEGRRRMLVYGTDILSGIHMCIAMTPFQAMRGLLNCEPCTLNPTP